MHKVYDINWFMKMLEGNFEPGRLHRIMWAVVSLQSMGGLTYAAMGLSLFASSVEDIIPIPYLGRFLGILALVVWLLAFKYVPGYYERRFGHVDPPKSPMTPRQALIFLSLVVLFVLYIVIWPFFGLAIGRQLDIFFGSLGDQVHLLIHDSEHLVRFGPILCCALFAAFSFGGWRDRNRDRALLLIMTIAALFWIVFLVYPLHHPAISQVLLWRILSAGWLGISTMTMGLFQHIRVVLLLPKRPQAQTDYD